MGPPPAGELDGEAADPARGAMNQHPLPGREPRVVEESLPGRQGGQRDCRGARVVEAAGFRGEVGGAHRDVLGRPSVPEEIGQPVDGVADLHISHVRCDSRDDAGDFVGGDHRKPAAAVGRLLDVPRELGRGDAGGMDADQRVARPERGNGGVLVDERFRASPAVDADRLHGVRRARACRVGACGAQRFRGNYWSFLR